MTRPALLLILALSGCSWHVGTDVDVYLSLDLSPEQAHGLACQWLEFSARRVPPGYDCDNNGR